MITQDSVYESSQAALDAESYCDDAASHVFDWYWHLTSLGNWPTCSKCGWRLEDAQGGPMCDTCRGV